MMSDLNIQKTIPIALVIPMDWRDNQLIIAAQVRRGKDFNGLLEFPGGKIEVGETPRVAAKREFAEEVGEEIELSKLKFFNDFEEVSSGVKKVFFCHLIPFRSLQITTLKKIKIGELSDIDDLANHFPPINKLIMTELFKALSENYTNHQGEVIWTL